MSERFYKNGLYFECNQCHACCRRDPGYVFLTEEDLNRLNTGLHMDRDAFLKTYCRVVPMGEVNRISLIEKENFDCIFWEEGGCRVYEDRPFQCQSFPFWPAYLDSLESWKNLENDCPGVNRGRFHSEEEINRWLEQRRWLKFLTT